MRKIRLFIVLAVLFAAGPVRAGDVGINFNLNVGSPGPVPIIVQEPPLFLVPPPLGFSVAVGVPYDMFLIDSRYYLFHGNVWYVGGHYNGPWTVIVHDHVPPGLRKHRINVIHEYRDREYGDYKREKDHYRGRSFRPEREHDHGKGRGHGNGKKH